MKDETLLPDQDCSHLYKDYWCESVTLNLWNEDDDPEWYYDYDSEELMPIR